MQRTTLQSQQCQGAAANPEAHRPEIRNRSIWQRLDSLDRLCVRCLQSAGRTCLHGMAAYGLALAGLPPLPDTPTGGAPLPQAPSPDQAEPDQAETDLSEAPFRDIDELFRWLELQRIQVDELRAVTEDSFHAPRRCGQD